MVEHESGGVGREVCPIQRRRPVYRPFIGDVLAQRPRLRAPRIDERVRRHGYPGSVVAVQRVRRASGRAVYRQVVILQPPVAWVAFSNVRLGRGVRSVSGGVMFREGLCISS